MIKLNLYRLVCLPLMKKMDAIDIPYSGGFCVYVVT
jgi:hypothetical protein